MSEHNDENLASEPEEGNERSVVENVSAEVVEETESKVELKKCNYQVDYEIDKVIEWDDNAETVTLPADFAEQARQVLLDTPNINLTDSDESRKWAAGVSEGLEFVTYGNVLNKTVNDEDAMFKQCVDHNGANLVAGSPKLKNIQNQNLKGERATIRLMSHIGLGTLFQTPLWHSGIWVTFKPPVETEIVELNRLLMSDKIRFGRTSYGLMFSNTVAYSTMRIVDFIIDHIYETSIKPEEVSVVDLKNIILSQDIPSLIWGFVCTMYPDGFQYQRSCIADPEKCNHVIQAKLNLSKLQWTNKNALSEACLAHMFDRKAKTKTKQNIIDYQKTILKTQKRQVDIDTPVGNVLKFILKSPTINEYIDAGQQWIGNITNTIEQAVGLNSSQEEKEELIKNHAQSTSMRQFGHWVESIEFESNVIDDKGTIDSTLNILSAEDDIRVKFLESVSDYIDESTISLIGIPVFDCPKCASTAVGKKVNRPEFANIIPLDVLQLFFDLLMQKMGRIRQR